MEVISLLPCKPMFKMGNLLRLHAELFEPVSSGFMELHTYRSHRIPDSRQAWSLAGMLNVENMLTALYTCHRAGLDMH